MTPAYRVRRPDEPVTTTLRASCGVPAFRCRCGPMPGLQARPRPTMSWMRYHSGRQGIPSPPMTRWRPAAPACRGRISTTPARCHCCRRCAPRPARAGAAPAIAVALPVPGDVRGLPAGTQFQRDAMAAGEAIIVDPRPVGRDRPGAGFRVRRPRRRGRVRTRTRCGAVMDGVFAARRAGGRAPRPRRGGVRAAVGGPVRRGRAGRAARRRRRAPTSPTRAGSSSRCWNPAGSTGFPTTPRHGRCGCWRTQRTSTRSSLSAPG